MSIIKLQGAQEKKQNCYYVFDTEGTILGEGGMGVVYLGKRIAANGTETPVAIKELKIKDYEIIERARREASIQLNNDNLVRMYGMIETENNDVVRSKNYYVISEYVDGVMLDDVLEGNLKNRDGVVSPKVEAFYQSYNEERNLTATVVIKSILSGVMALHDAGYIHRDIDPTNIMLTSEGKIKLIDFGIAKKVANVQSQKSELTTPGQFMGKAEYAAPELILGDTRNQNFCTDIYSIGVLYYQLVVGQVPFKGTKYEVIEDQLRKKLPLKKITSWQIRDIISKATEKKQSDRYASSALFRAAIDNIIYPEPRRINYNVIKWAVACLLVAGLIGFGLSHVGKTQTNSEEMVEIDSMQLEQERYQNSLALLNSSIEDSIKKGFEEVKQIAEEGNSDAMFEIAYTYAMTMDDKDLKLAARKTALKLQSGIDNARQNEEAIKWLERTIGATDSADYRALYLLAPYKFLKNDIAGVKDLCTKCINGAEKAGDTEYAEMAKKTLKQIPN